MELGGSAGAVLTTIRTVAETGSTNADLLTLARSGVPEGLWLRAERQTGGRGRQGRPWDSPAGNLYASTLVRLRPSDPFAATLSLVIGVALHETVTAYLGEYADLLLKWPNDLLAGGAKLAGILLERADDAVVIGVGVNVATSPALADRPTANLTALGTGVSAGTVTETLAESFARWLARWRGEGLAAIREAWLARAHPIGAAVAFHAPDGSRIEGLFAGLANDGAMMLRLADGTTHAMHAGDVFLLD